jgi:hypothetical protein
MANRFWVGGSGTWDGASTANWSATSGGAPGASAPTAVDDVFFNASSGSPTVVVQGAICRNWTHTAGVAVFDYSLFGSSNVYGSLTWWTSSSVIGSVQMLFWAESGSHTINFAGRALSIGTGFAQTLLHFGPGNDPVTATWTLAGTFNAGTSSGTIRLGRGTLNTNGVALQNWGSILAVGQGDITLTLGASAVGTALAPLFEFRFEPYFAGVGTLNLGTSAFSVYSATIQGFQVGQLTVTSSAGQVFNGVNIEFLSPSRINIAGSNLCVLRAISGFTSVDIESIAGTLPVGAISTVSTSPYQGGVNFYGAGAVSATSITQTATDPLSTAGAIVVIDCAGFTCGAISQHAAAPFLSTTGSRIEETSSGPVTVTGTITTQSCELTGSSTGSFAAITLLASDGFASRLLINKGGATTTGALIANTVELSSNTTLVTGTVTSIASTARESRIDIGGTGSVSMTSLNVGSGGTRWDMYLNGGNTFTCGAASVLQINGGNANLVVNFTGTVTCADDPVSGRQGFPVSFGSAQSISFTSLVQTGITSTNLNNFFSSCGTVTFTGGATVPATIGFSLPNTSFSYPAAPLVIKSFFMGINSAPRTLTLASGATVTVSDNFTVREDVTVTAAGTTLTLVHDNATNTETYFEHRGQTFGAVVATGTNIRLLGSALAPSLGVTTFSRTGAANAFSQLRLQNTNLICSGAITLQGNSATNRLFVFSQNDGAQATISSATRTLTNVDFRNIAAAGGIVPWALGTSVGDCQNNTNITFTPSETRYAVASGVWNSTAVWSTLSGGAGGASVPLPQDDVQFNSGSGAINVTTGTVRALCRDLFMVNFTGTLVLNRSAITSGVANLAEIYGNAEIGVGTNISTSAGTRLLTRKVGTGTFLNSSSLADIRLLGGNTDSLTVTMAAGTLQGITPFSGGMTLNATGNIGSITSGSGAGSQDSYNLPSPTPATALELGTSVLTVSSINTTAVIDGGTSSLTLLVSAAFSTQAWNGNIHNFTLQNTSIDRASVAFSASQNNGVSGNFSTAPSTFASSVTGKLTFTGAARLQDAGTINIPLFFGTPTVTMSVVNNTSTTFETQYAFFILTSASGTKALPRLNAFGAANLGQNTGISFPTPLKVAAFSEGFDAAWAVPNDFGGSYYIIAYGAGGQAGKASGEGSSTGGGGGGAYALTYGTTRLNRGSVVRVRAPAASGPRTTVGSGATPASSYLNLAGIATPPATPAQGVVAAAGAGSSSSGGSGGSTANSVGSVLINGASGGSGSSSSYGGGGGGGAPGGGGMGGSGSGGDAASPRGGGGGGGTSTAGSMGVLPNGGAGGSPNGGAGGVGNNNNPLTRPGANALATSGGGGGGGGAQTAVNLSNRAYTRIQGSTTVNVTATAHGLTVGQPYVARVTMSRPGGNYSRSGTLVTCNFPGGHGLTTTGQSVFIDFTSGGALDGTYVVTVVTSTQFRVTTAASGFISNGFFNFGPLPPISDFALTVSGPNNLSFTTAQSTYLFGTVTLNVYPLVGEGFSTPGGSSGVSVLSSVDYYNGVAVSGTVGISGGGGGGGAITTSSTDPLTVGGRGGSSVVGGGGGGGGAGKTGSGDGGGGGAGLVLFVYGGAIENVESQIIF